MSRRCQHNHHRPRVFKGRRFGNWFTSCKCGWARTCFDWHHAYVAALDHSQELTS